MNLNKLTLLSGLLMLLIGIVGVSAEFDISEEEFVTGGFKPCIVGDSNGNFHMIVIDDGLRYLKKTPGMTWWDANVMAETVPGSESVSAEWSRPRLECDNDGNAYVCWSIADSLFFTRRFNGAWETPQIIAYKWGGGWSTVADGQPIWDEHFDLLHMVYSRAIDGYWSIWHMVSYDRGLSWLEEDLAISDGITASGEADANGFLHIGLLARCGKVYNVWHPDLGWYYGEDGQGIDFNKCIDETTLTASPDGTPHSIWGPFECQGDDCYYLPIQYSRKINGVWQTPVEISDIPYFYPHNGFKDYIPQSAAFSANEVVSAYAIGDYSTLYFSYMENGVWTKDMVVAQVDSSFFSIGRTGSEAAIAYFRGGIHVRTISVSNPTEWQMASYITTNQEMYLPGDNFLLNATVYSGEPDCKNIDVYIVLEVLGNYWFWPSWRQSSPDALFQSVCPPVWSLDVLDFEWPSGAGSFDGAVFHMAACQQGTFTVAGGAYGYSSCSFDFDVPSPTPKPTRTPAPTSTPTEAPTFPPFPTPTPTPSR